MPRFPRDRVYRRPRRSLLHYLTLTLALAFMVTVAWGYALWTDARAPVPVAGQKLVVVDGDSFALGPRKLRLDGIDAPEYRQNCRDARGSEWACGRAARAALEQLLTGAGLACEAEAHDRYARALATCRSASTPDLAAAQVLAGMAVSDEFHGMRSYGAEEDAAKAARRGIWQGDFVRPADFRAGLATGQ